MKILMITILLFSTFGWAKTSSKDMLSAQFDSYLKQKTKEIDGDVEKDVKAVAALKLNENADLNLLKNVLLTLVKLDETDPSRTTTMMLAQSYARNKRLYVKAFASIKNSENKTIVEELEKLMNDFSFSGNG